MDERRTARNWYWWLWLSPLLTIPTLVVLDVRFSSMLWEWACGGPECDTGRANNIIALVAIAVSGLWHLILLIPALGGKSAFVRWHGRQALLLAAVQTAIFLSAPAIDSWTSLEIAISLLILVWFVGTLWGQLQAGRGKCALMRLFGRKPELTTPAAPPNPPESTEALLDIICYSADPGERRRAAEELIRRGRVELL